MKSKWGTILAMTSLWLCGCAEEVKTGEQSGQLALALSAPGTNGVLYGLEATLIANGPEELTAELSHLDGGFQRELVAGDYEVTLSDYRLFRMDGAQPTEVDRAVLLSANPGLVSVPVGGLAELLYTFAVPGGEVSFETGTLEVLIDVLEGLPEGSTCAEDSDCASGVCLTERCAPAIGDGVSAELSCPLPLGFGQLDLEAAVSIVPISIWTANGTLDVLLEAQLSFSEELSELVLALGEQELVLEDVVVEFAVVGAEEELFLLSTGPMTMNLGNVPQVISFVIPEMPAVLLSDGSPAVEFTVNDIQLWITEFPLLGEIVVTRDPSASTLDCTLSSSRFVVPVEPDEVEPPPVCSIDAPSISELIEDPFGSGPPPPSMPLSLDATVDCGLDLGIGGPSSVDLFVEITPALWVTIESPLDLGFQAFATLPASLGQLLVDLGTDMLNLDSIFAEISVEGATPNPIEVRIDAASFDVDADDDGIAEKLIIDLSVDPTTLMTECVESVDFTVSHFEAVLVDVPLLGTLVVSEDPELGSAHCSLFSSTASFSTLNP